MDVYLPIAEMSVNAAVVVALSLAVGFLSGMVGVGGGFIMTPLLLFLGIPPAVAVATEMSQVTASSVSGALGYSRRRLVDPRMALLLTIGGLAGGAWGVQLFAFAARTGSIDVVVQISYVLLLTAIGALMLWESLSAMRREALGKPSPRRRERPLLHKLPLRMRFPRSGLYISVLPPLMIGFLVGMLAALLGVGGGFILVPAMIYLLRMPTQTVVGTSLLQILIVSAFVTVLQSVQTQAVDAILAAMLIVGGVIGAQLGVRTGMRLSAERLRALLGVVVFGAGIALLWDLVSPPGEPFSIRSG